MLTDNTANAALDALLGTVGILPATVYIGLLKAVPNPDGSGVVEPIGNGYGRISRANNFTEWPPASARIKTHANDIIFAAATGIGWGTVTHVGIFDTLSGGNLRAYDLLAIPRNVTPTDIFRFLAGTATALKITTP